MNIYNDVTAYNFLKFSETVYFRFYPLQFVTNGFIRFCALQNVQLVSNYKIKEELLGVLAIL